MPASTVVLRSQPGIKRDGTKYDGDFYTDGQWVRFQRGLPRKIGGYRSITKYLTEISRGLAAFTSMDIAYAHSGSATLLQRFTIDTTLNSSIMTDRTPTAIAAIGTLTLATGGAGSVDSVTVNGVTITSGSVAFNVSLGQTATDVASNITAHTSVPNYTAAAVGTTITITAVTANVDTNGYVVAATLTTITVTATPMAGGNTALIPSANNQWMFDYMYDPTSAVNSVIANVAPNGDCSCNNEGGQIFYGNLEGTDRLVNIKIPSTVNATGGMVILHPYLFYYGSDGVIGWSIPGDPTDLSGTGSGSARVWGQKIIKGLPLRAGSGSAPAGLFWANDAVIRSTFVGGAAIFNFDVVASDTSIMSAACVVDFDGVFYWAGVDRFLMFNGVVREVPNPMNLNWFFDSINEQQRTKVFAFKVARFGEIWWCYPRGTATECTHAVIYNVRENAWYDTKLPNSGRSAGVFGNLFARPLLTGVDVEPEGYKVWIHESGVDSISGQTALPVESYFETADISAVAKGNNSALRITQIEPDFIQSGDMTVQITGRANARAPEVYSTLFTFPDSATLSYQQIVMLKEQRRELRAKFTSNTIGGNYEMGQVIAHIDTADHRSLA